MSHCSSRSRGSKGSPLKYVKKILHFVHATFQSMFGSAKYFLSVGRKTHSAVKKIYRQGAITISQHITSEPTTSVLPSKNHQW